MVSNIDSYIYIYHLGLKFNLPTLPDSLSDTMPIEFSTQPVLARSAPQISWSSAGPRSTQIVIPIHRHIFAMENSDFKVSDYLPKESLKKYGIDTDALTKYDAADVLINALISLSLPRYSDAEKAITPPSVLVRYGNEFCIRGVPSSVTKTSSGPWLKGGKMAMVTLQFTVTEVEPYSAEYALQAGTLRGVSTDLMRSNAWQ